LIAVKPGALREVKAILPRFPAKMVHEAQSNVTTWIEPIMAPEDRTASW
jgi:hypothetical protein